MSLYNCSIYKAHTIRIHLHEFWQLKTCPSASRDTGRRSVVSDQFKRVYMGVASRCSPSCVMYVWLETIEFFLFFHFFHFTLDGVIELRWGWGVHVVREGGWVGRGLDVLALGRTGILSVGFRRQVHDERLHFVSSGHSLHPFAHRRRARL